MLRQKRLPNSTRCKIRDRVEGVSVEMVIQKISALGLEVSRALADVSEKLNEEVQLLAIVREAVAVERKELEHLHKIDVASTAIDQLIQDYAREKQRFEEEIAAQRAAWRKTPRDSSASEKNRKKQSRSSDSARLMTTSIRNSWTGKRLKTNMRKNCEFGIEKPGAAGGFGKRVAKTGSSIEGAGRRIGTLEEGSR